MESVLAINFAQDPNAYEALTTLKELDGQGQVTLAGAAVVLRNEKGGIESRTRSATQATRAPRLAASSA